MNPGAAFGLSWTQLPGDTHYILLENRSLVGGTYSPAPESPVASSGIVLTRTNGNYKYEVEACRGSLCSAPSNTKIVLVCLPANC